MAGRGCGLQLRSWFSGLLQPDQKLAAGDNTTGDFIQSHLYPAD
jgi:hypothetical protein